MNMEKSHNVLVIDSLKLDWEDRCGFDEFEPYVSSKSTAMLKAEIRYTCPITKNLFRTVNLEYRSRNNSPTEAARQVVEDFINGKVYNIDTDLKMADIKCIPCNELHAVDFMNLIEPWRSMFEDLFDATKWQIPVKELAG